MPCWMQERGDNIRGCKNYLAKGWLVECVDDSKPYCRPILSGYGGLIVDVVCMVKKGELYRVQECDEGYFVELEGVPGLWRTDRFRVFTSELENLKYEVPVKIKLPIASK